MVTPGPFYGVLIKFGLTETLTFIMGFVYGPVAGLTGGVSIILISDIIVVPGVWTPFIAGIIGVVFGLGGGVIRRFAQVPPKAHQMLAAAVFLTLVSEFLQNAWVTAFYGIPLVATVISGIPTLVAALVNNGVLLSVVGPRVISIIKGDELKSNL